MGSSPKSGRTNALLGYFVACGKFSPYVVLLHGIQIRFMAKWVKVPLVRFWNAGTGKEMKWSQVHKSSPYAAIYVLPSLVFSLVPRWAVFPDNGSPRNSEKDEVAFVEKRWNKTQKRVTALNRELPPRNEQFLFDFEQLQGQFPDQEQLRSMTESVLISLVVQCSSHAPRAEFILFALRSLCSIGYINWDTLLPSLLSSVSSAETAVGQGSQAMATASSTSLSQSGIMPSSSAIPNSSNFQPSNPASPLPSIHGIGSPAQSATEPSSCVTLSPVKSSDISCTGQQAISRVHSTLRDNAISCLRQLSCKIILAALESNLKPVTHADIFYHILNWLVNWDQRQQGIDESDGAKAWKPDRVLNEWLHSCLDVIWLLVEEDKCRVPFYELLRSGLQFIENIPDDEALFTLILEIHRRRDMMAMHMQMLDQHLHCPTFGTHRFLSQTYPTISGEPLANVRYSPITYPSVLGEPLHGEDLATSIQRGSLDWERALRCIRHALHTTPSPDWWRRVLLVAPCYRSQALQVPNPGAVFSSEMICCSILRQYHAYCTILIPIAHFGNGLPERCSYTCRIGFSDIRAAIPIIFLILAIPIKATETNCWQEWLIFADIFYFLMKSGCIDFVDFVDKLVSRVTEGEHHILRSNHVTWLLAQIIRIEIVTNALNTDPRKFLFLGERMMDYMNLDDRSIGMFWVLSYTMAQPACEAVMNWLTSAGVTELLPGSNLQSNERVMVMRESCPLPMSLLSGLSINLCVKLAYQIEESLFFGQVIPSIAMVETYARLLLIAPHSLFRSHFNDIIICWNSSFFCLCQIYAEFDTKVSIHIEQAWGVSPPAGNIELSFTSPLQVPWEKQGLDAETTVINQCTQLLSPSADPTYVMTYISHSFPQHRQYLCAGAWMLMHGHPENINSANLGRVLREFSPEEVTSNIYTMVDVLLHHIHVELQHGNPIQDLQVKASSNLAFFIWTHELLPLDILLLALIDRDDDPHALRIVISLLDRQELQQRVKLFCLNRGPPEHWIHSGLFKRAELQKALGNHLSWKDR
ncbi:hypothetical protein HHK36_029944 [Tetracentron sinense]|uniref:Mediator of RNA polymerase II transcription subunit 23 n=1 Tax=Tetracentron sinense TaxID=13715 RepID=A0A835D272_TETSI|nr:hypothetical protein HHK36_029944 [Tetracentron sinense]